MKKKGTGKKCCSEKKTEVNTTILNEVVARYVQIINGEMPEKCSRLF